MDSEIDTAAAARARTRRAGNLLHAGRFEQALAEYDWVWRHLLEAATDMRGVRASFTAVEIGRLCREFAPAQAHFEALRDAAGATLDAGADDPGLRIDWMLLNEIVGEADRTLTWWERIAVADLSDAFLDECIPRLVPLLRRRGRWAEIGSLFRAPLAKLREDHATLLAANATTANARGFRGMSPQDLMSDLFREQTSILVRGLRAAGRGDEAEAVATEALAFDDSTEMRAAVANPQSA